jgi:hypothetical protein
MSYEEMSGDYEVGYSRPPKETRFQKGISGNPKGRPKKIPDFDTELLRESKALITITDNGQRRRISKFQGIVKQLHNKALTGNITATRLYLSHYQQALERAALSVAQQPKSLEDYDDVRKIPEKELERFIWEEMERQKREAESDTQ